jgi:tetratricopeptide (TPR) repeat protein
MKVMRAACAAAIFLGVSVSSPVAWADTSTAETLFQEGLAAMKRNDFTIACEAFDKSNKQDPSPGTQINLAICYEKQKKWASAWTWYRSAAGLAQQRNQPQREQNATESAKRLEPQLHHVMISVKNGAPDTVVKRDGNEITVSLGGKDVALPFDPGEHVIEIKATGKKTLTKSIVTPDTPATSDKAEVLPFTLEDAPVDPNAGLDTGGPAAKTTVIRTESDGSTQRLLGVIAGGAGVLTGLAAAGVFILANKDASDRDEQQAVYTDPTMSDGERAGAAKSANSHNDAANNDQLIALILTGGAVVMVGLGAVLFFTAPKSKEKTATLVPTPIAGPNFQGLGVVGTF